jgi:tellurite resistance protein TerC
MSGTALWFVFGGIVLVSMALDLGVFHRKAHSVGFKESLTWTGIWITLALLLGGVVYAVHGPGTAIKYTTCYLTEYALSVDNLFVFVVLFRFFAVPSEHQHRVLFWGILGALAMRALFIFAGVAVVERFHWTIYVLGAFLVYTGFKLAFSGEGEVEPDKNPVLRFSRRFLRVTGGFEGSKFFTKQDGRLFATPLFLCLMMVETTDVLFAVDSVPVGIGVVADKTGAITPADTFALYSSNVMAICGLRSLYFAVAGLIDLFRFLKHGLSLILVFVGVSMLGSRWWHVPIGWKLSVVGGILVLAIVASLAFRKKAEHGSPG